jgi:hypothetical protein
MSRLRLAVVMAALVWAGSAAAQFGSDPIDLDHPAVAYRTSPTTDGAARLNQRLERGEAQLTFEEGTGYLRSLLKQLGVPVESQIVVYSKTSLQGNLITPSNPRSIFFNDSVAVGWMPGGFIEIAAHDPAQGASFYILPQTWSPLPRMLRDNRCTLCHYSAIAEGVPGFFTRSIPTAADGSTLQWLGNAAMDHRTPLEERWGGWYVTGTHGSLKHLGNLSLTDRRASELPPWSSAQTLSTLTGRFDTTRYLSPHSDIVALLVFAHQARMMNLLTRVGWESRIAAATGPAAAARTLHDDVVSLVDYMLFVDEAPLDRVRGTSGYAEWFSAQGPRDSKGRSLRELDLQKRLMRYPCSYVIYSDAFDALPADTRAAIYARLKQVLSGEDRAPKYAKLTTADRQAIREILRDTKKDLPAAF